MENEQPHLQRARTTLRQVCRFVRQDLPALSLLQARHRRVTGHILTMHQSGSHWLNHMLAAGLTREHHLPELDHIRDRRIIGRPQDAIVFPHIPRIIQSHEVPGPLVHAWPLPRLLRFPKYVLLVRDLRAALVSNYEKKKHLEAYRKSFSEFLRNDRLIGNEIPRDLWFRMRQLNAWDRDLRRLPAGQVLVVHYEDMQRDASAELRQVWTFFGLPDRGAEFFDAAVQASTKDRMGSREQPGGRSKIVRQSNRNPYEWFSADDRKYFTRTVRTWLNNPFGYDYEHWTIPSTTTAAAA